QPTPGVAERWEISPDGKVYTFHLRDARWSDGHPVTAGDFVWSWTRVLDPKTAAKYAEQLFVIQGGEAFNAGKAPASALGLAAPDDHTLVVTLKEPIPYFLQSLTNLYTYDPVPRWVIEGLAAKGIDPDLWTRPEHFVSNGPFVLKEWHFRHYMLFEKNPLLWNDGSVKIRRVKVLAI